MVRHWLSAVAIVATVSLAGRAQPQAPAASPPATVVAPMESPAPQARFAAGTDLVQVDVSVLDGQRRPVTGLTAADFTLLEDGKPVPIDVFTAVDLPERTTGADASWMRGVPRDVASNQIMQDEGRLVLILMDRSIPQGLPQRTAKQIAAAAVDQLGPSDLAAIVSTSPGAVVQNLTHDRTRLLQAIGAGDASGQVSPTSREIDEALQGDLGVVLPQPEDGRCLCGLCVLEKITQLADTVRDSTRRAKVLLFIGSGVLFQTSEDATGCNFHIRDARTAMLRALDLAHLTIHSIDPAGLENVGPISQASSTLRTRAVAANVSRARDEHQQSQDSLGVLPERTGGRVVANTNAPEEMLPAIFRESQSYYLLGFKPSAALRGDAVRSIEVKVDRRGVNVHARRSYVAPASSSGQPSALPAGQPTAAADASASPSRAAAALVGLLPSARLPLDLNVAVFATPGSPRALTTLAVGIDAFAPAAGEAAGPPESLEVVAAAYDRRGTPRASARQRVELAWSRETGAPPRHVDVLSRLDLAPGDYQIRVGVAGGDATRAASVFTDITVPPFSSVPLALSSIVMAAGARDVIVPRDFLAGALPLAPTTERTFRRTDSATAFMRIYQGTSRIDALAPVQVQSRIIDSGNRVVRDQSLTFGADAFTTDRTADVRLNLPVAHLAPGEYVLNLEATLGPRTAGRAMRFTVSTP